ncbi:MAG: hypothetical protein MSG64_21000 [Pyrinomonadaceae bacterium MAG19_C2-C3]|nr:hypothetical protein [Pyrinomonadaceae bacterium MAG19_C2-C3]
MASNILTATVEAQGTRPLLWHRFGADTIPASGKKERQGVAGNDPSEWQRSVLLTNERQLYLEPSYIFGAVRDGARHTKRGRGTLQPMVAATLQVTDDRVLVDRFLPEDTEAFLTHTPDDPVYLDIRSVKNPATRARNVRYRVAASAGWKARFTIMWDMTVVSRGEMEAAVRDAGMLAGIGDGRSIGFGRFGVERFDISASDD